MEPESDSSTNAWNPDDYDDDYSFVHEYGNDVIDLLKHEPGDRIIDLGCGTGHLTADLAKRGASVTGVDNSAKMIARAREAYPDLKFIHADAQSLDEVIEREFDAAFSNAVLHWILDQDAVLSSVRTILRPGGQFVGEFGGTGNVGTIVSETEAELSERGYEWTNPWYFPSIGEYTTDLEDHGFEVRYATLFDRWTELEGEDGLRDWLRMFGDSFFAEVSDDELSSVLSSIEARVEATLHENNTWYIDYRRLRFRAIREY